MSLSVFRKAHAASVAQLSIVLVIVALPPLIGAQQPTPVPTGRLSHAIDIAAHYLESVCDENGKFTYLVDPESGKISPSYNILRHAGAIYSLAMFNQAHPDQKAVDAMVRAAAFMRKNYMGPDANSHALAVWSEPLPDESDAELGAAGLALIALTALDKAKPETVPLADLQGLARFVLFMQKSDGSFTSKYSPDTGPDEDFNSLYYPGEASLGLISLYQHGSPDSVAGRRRVMPSLTWPKAGLTSGNCRRITGR